MSLFTGILRYMLYMPVHVAITIISYILVPFLILFQKDGWLPNWCWWFQTWDNSLDGDTGWQNYHRPFLDEYYESLSSFKRYISRVLWLYRNPVYGFEKKILAAYTETLEVHSKYPNMLVSSPDGYFFWNGEKPVTENYKINWLIGWKLTFPSRPISICTTVRFQKI